MPKSPRKIVQENVIIETRQLLKIGRSHYISVPKEFLEAHNLKAGDWLPIAANHILKIIPMSESRKMLEIIDEPIEKETQTENTS